MISSAERSEIRKEYRECLKRFNRIELISTYTYVPINSVAMAHSIISLSQFTDEQIRTMIIDRDVSETIKHLESRNY